MDLKSRFENIKQDSQSSQINEHDAGKNPERTLLDDFKEVQAALLNEALEDIDTIDNENIERDIQSDPLNLKRPPALFKKWKTLAEQGDAFAQHKLGHIYRIGKGVAQDYKEAVRWFRRAAEKGDRDGRFELGLSYFNGQGVIQDYKEAERFWRLAAEDGHLIAQDSLGVLYAEGKGVIKDYAIAYMWFNIAASRGSKNAVKNRDAVQENMTTSQIESAQKMTRECIEKNKKEVADRLPNLPPTSTFVEMVMDYKNCG